MYIFLLIPIISALASFLLIRNLAPKLRNRSITGEDMHKEERPILPEMGGLAIAGGFTAGLLSAIAFDQFTNSALVQNLEYLLAAGITILIVLVVGMIDDLLGVEQITKAITPALAALPLIAVKVGKTAMVLPLLGEIEFGLFYPLLFVPLGVTGAANAVNMLAGFNGLETGLGAIMFITLAFISWHIEAWAAFFLLVSALPPTLIIFYFHWYPADVFIGDTGTLTIGAIVASSVIIGNFEYAGIILFFPYYFDLLMKATHGFPKSFGKEVEGKLYCPKEGPVGLAQLVLKLTGGVSEKTLVGIILVLECIFALLAVLYYIPTWGFIKL